jgi:GNAT superfamily N-acetyltransferase
VTNTYEIRPYESGDREGFLSLYELVFGEAMDTDWFAWKYENNPYVDHVPILVATADGRIVGARPFFALNMSCNRIHDVVLQPCDAMVHPDHRRRGLFTRMTEQAIERYRDECRYFFNFPNHRSLPGNLELGWRKVAERVFYYRIENPGRVLAARSDRTSVRLAGRFGTVLARGYYRLRDTLASSPDLSIRKESEVPVDELTSLYRRSVPDGIHVVRDEPFYEWRFENPEWNYTTYLAETEKGVEAALVTGASPGSGPNKTRFVDTIPLQPAPEHVLAALFEGVLTDHTDTDLFCTSAQGIPESVLRRFGFHPDNTLPLSLLNTQTTHVVRALTEEWEANGVDITDSDNWLLTFAEHDTS